MRPVPSRLHQQRGIVMLLMLVILIVGASALLLRSLSSVTLRMERDKVTADALAQAREALIGYAAMANLSTGRPGDLPCPDKHTPGSAQEGTPSTPCNSNAIGRLPWKTLGLGELRDASGERLWYAVSTNFKNSTRTGILNSDTPGTITIRAPDGSVLNDGNSMGGAVAVIIAPGEPLQRQDGIQQDRSSAGANVPGNYLDIATIGGITEDNANFTDSSSTDGFIQGQIKDANNSIIVNDALLVITQDNIMQALQKRVATEVKLCLVEYGAIPQNYGRYPWTTNPTNIASYSDMSGILFGRIPDQIFTNTNLDSGGTMKNVWGPNCNIPYGSWWANWKEMVFYGLADAYKPLNPPSTPTTCGTCLTVNPPSSSANKKFVVIVAGKKLAGQNRPSTNLNDYLEAPDNTGAALFAQSAPSATFNDTVIFQ